MSDKDEFTFGANVTVLPINFKIEHRYGGKSISTPTYMIYSTQTLSLWQRFIRWILRKPKVVSIKFKLDTFADPSYFASPKENES